MIIYCFLWTAVCHCIDRTVYDNNSAIVWCVLRSYEDLFLNTGSKPEVVMGSKVSSKMAAPAARVIQAVRPHTPLIKFPNRQDMVRPNAQEVLKTLAVNFSPHASGSHPATAPPPLSRPHVPLTPIPGTADTLASIQLLPARYRRRPLTVDEMDFIQRGGPE
ncbi:alpha-ketoglutarate dehydrogenase component 4 isoform X1 [Chaetodon trifascialis]|uniref:alpha-ketoglutarate dehydrogenase component 4 isoform X1 n=1 Tax=Chaetodon trifascialis TaxID=109706 RepID=UPI003991816B